MSHHLHLLLVCCGEQAAELGSFHLCVSLRDRGARFCACFISCPALPSLPSLVPWTGHPVVVLQHGAGCWEKRKFLFIRMATHCPDTGREWHLGCWLLSACHVVFTASIFPPCSWSHMPSSSDVRVPWKLDSELSSSGVDYGPPFQNFHLGLQFP